MSTTQTTVEQLLGAAESLAGCIGSGYSSAESQSALWAYYRIKQQIRGGSQPDPAVELDAVWTLLHRAMSVIEDLTFSKAVCLRLEVEIEKIQAEIIDIQGHQE